MTNIEMPFAVSFSVVFVAVKVKVADKQLQVSLQLNGNYHLVSGVIVRLWL